MNDNTVLNKNEQDILSKTQNGNTQLLTSNDMPALINGILHSASDVYNATMQAVCEDKKLKAMMITQMQTAISSMIDSESEIIDKLVQSNEANLSLIRNMITTDMSDERLKMCFDELRYYEAENQKIMSEHKKHNDQLVNHVSMMQNRTISEECFVISKNAVAAGAKAIVENPQTWQLLTKLIVKFFS